jgi:hypothetical protein
MVPGMQAVGAPLSAPKSQLQEIQQVLPFRASEARDFLQFRQVFIIRQRLLGCTCMVEVCSVEDVRTDQVGTKSDLELQHRHVTIIN